MKKLVFLLLLIPVIAFAGFKVDGVTNPAKVDGVALPAKVDGVTSNYCDDCSGDLMMSVHFENLDITSGTPCGCLDGGDSTMTAAGDGNATLSGVRKSDGTYSGLYPDGNEYHLLSSATSAQFSRSEGKLIMDIYVGTFIANANVFKAYNGTDHLTIRMQGTSSALDFRVHWYNGTDNAYLTCDDGGHIDEAEWLRLTLQWKLSESAADWKMTVCELTPPDTTANCQTQGPEDNLSTWTGDVTNIFFGNNTANAAAFNIDNTEIFATSGL